MTEHKPFKRLEVAWPIVVTVTSSLAMALATAGTLIVEAVQLKDANDAQITSLKNDVAAIKQTQAETKANGSRITQEIAATQLKDHESIESLKVTVATIDANLDWLVKRAQGKETSFQIGIDGLANLGSAIR